MQTLPKCCLSPGMLPMTKGISAVDALWAHWQGSADEKLVNFGRIFPPKSPCGSYNARLIREAPFTWAKGFKVKRCGRASLFLARGARYRGYSQADSSCLATRDYEYGINFIIDLVVYWSYPFMLEKWEQTRVVMSDPKLFLSMQFTVT